LPLTPKTALQPKRSSRRQRECVGGKGAQEERMTARKKILIADDEPHLALLAKTRLEANGYEVLTVTDGREAVDQAKAWRPDLIILDMSMPILSGHEACEILKAQDETRLIPIMMLTGTPQKHLLTQCEEAGVSAILMKPYKADHFLAVIESVINKEIVGGKGYGKKNLSGG